VRVQLGDGQKSDACIIPRHVFETSGKQGQGLQEPLDWLTTQIQARQDRENPPWSFARVWTWWSSLWSHKTGEDTTIILKADSPEKETV
jgi:hypothetical protein